MNIRDIIAVVCITTLVSFVVQYVTLNSLLLNESGRLLKNSQYLDFNVESKKMTDETIVESKKRTGETIVESERPTVATNVESKTTTSRTIVESMKITGDIESKEVTGQTIVQSKKITGESDVESKNKTRDKSDYGIHIIGERHTGTSWLQNHLQQCFGDQVKVYDRLSRHKYWFQLDDETKDYGLVVATFRNVYDWLEAMRRKPLHAPLHYQHEANRPMGMRSFIRTVWLPTRSNWIQLKILQDDENRARNATKNTPLYLEKCYDRFSYYDIVPCSYNDRVRSSSLVLLGKTSDDDDGDSGAVYEMKKNHNQSKFEPYANIVSLRRDKMLNFYSEVQAFSSVEHYIAVKFEDLVQAGTLSLIKDIKNKMNLKSRCGAEKMTFFGSSDTKIVSRELIQLINDKIDWTVEAQVGYEPLSPNTSSNHFLIVDSAVPLLNISTPGTRIGLEENYVPTLDEPYLEPKDSNATMYKTINYTLDNILESIHLSWHPEHREERFPSVEERVKVYMSNWYQPCHNSSVLGVKVDYYNRSYPLMNLNPEAGVPFRVDSVISFDKPIMLHPETLDICLTDNSSFPLYKERLQGYKNYVAYCRDAVGILSILKKIEDSDLALNGGKNWSSVPVIVQFGDSLARSRTVPVLSKFRIRAFNKEFLTQDSSCNDPYLKVVQRSAISTWTWDSYYWDTLPLYQPIIWTLKSERHFGKHLEEARTQDIPWEDKKLGAVWIGHMTGGPNPSLMTPDMSNIQICLWNSRCRFVYEHRNSSLVYARLSSSVGYQLKREEAPELFGHLIKKKDILQYKIVISLEGNDVSSGLKWMLFSNSIVMMPPPTVTSWLMEELLEPWVHYIPLNQDGSNAEEMIRWVGENDIKARKIAERSTLFMYDLVYHADAAEDDLAIKKEILRRYSGFWN